MLAIVCVTLLFNGSFVCSPPAAEDRAQEALARRREAPAEVKVKDKEGRETVFYTSPPFLVREGEENWGRALVSRMPKERR